MSISPALSLANPAQLGGNTSLVLDHVRAAFGVWSSVLAGRADVNVRVELASLGSSGSSKSLATTSIDQFSYTGADRRRASL